MFNTSSDNDTMLAQGALYMNTCCNTPQVVFPKSSAPDFKNQAANPKLVLYLIQEAQARAQTPQLHHLPVLCHKCHLYLFDLGLPLSWLRFHCSTKQAALSHGKTQRYVLCMSKSIHPLDAKHLGCNCHRPAPSTRQMAEDQITSWVMQPCFGRWKGEAAAAAYMPTHHS